MTTTNYMWVSGADSSTAAGFRVWASAICVALRAMGLVKTADTGQADWATAALPAANTSGVYEIYRLNDSLQSTYPIFFRFDFMPIATASGSGIRMQISTGTNGAGVPSGVMFDSTNSLHGGTINPLRIYSTNAAIGGNAASGDGEFFCLILNNQAIQDTPLQIVFERSRDTVGNPTGDGIFVGFCGVCGGNVSRFFTAAYGSSTKYMITSYLNSVVGTLTPFRSMGVATPGVPVSPDPNNPTFYRLPVYIPSVGGWTLRNFLVPFTRPEADMATVFRADPDGKGSRLFRFNTPVANTTHNFFGFGTGYTIPLAYVWAD